MKWLGADGQITPDATKSMVEASPLEVAGLVGAAAAALQMSIGPAWTMVVLRGLLDKIAGELQ